MIDAPWKFDVLKTSIFSLVRENISVNSGLIENKQLRLFKRVFVCCLFF